MTDPQNCLQLHVVHYRELSDTSDLLLHRAQL